MRDEWFSGLVKATVITLTMAAVLQELEKPPAEREWHGKIAGCVPYDFRLPTLERIRETYWNPNNSHLLTPEAFGVGWAVNIHALLERLRLIGQHFGSEEDFLMPTKSIKEVITNSPAMLLE